jgi:biopolymer transport protein ExbD
MRRFSQRNSLVTLNDINITPLIDLAFVLLIIFVITTPLLEQGMNLKLPQGGGPDNVKLDPSNIRTVEVSQRGDYMLRRQIYSLDKLVALLDQEHKRNPHLIVYVRADENSPYKNVAALLNRLERASIDQVSLRTEPGK